MPLNTALVGREYEPDTYEVTSEQSSTISNFGLTHFIVPPSWSLK